MEDNSSNVSSRDLLCQSATLISSSPYYKTVIISECIFALLAITPNALLLSVVWRAIVLPANLRLLLGHLSFVFVWFSLGDIAKSIYVLSQDPCSFTMTMRGCRLFDLASTWLTLPNIYYSLIPLCVERLYATIKYRNYDRTTRGRKPRLAIFLMVCAWTSAMVINGRTVFNLPYDRYIPMCEIPFVQQQQSSYPMAISISYFILELLASTATMFLYFYNRYIATSMAINRALYDLSARFQIDQNIQINFIIVPSMILHFIFHLPTFALGLAIQNTATVSLQTRTCLVRSTFLWRLIYAFIHPIIAFHVNTHLKYHLSKTKVGKIFERMGIELDTKKNTRRNGNNSASVITVAHFQYLDEMWARVKKPTRPGRRCRMGTARNECPPLTQQNEQYKRGRVDVMELA